MFRLQLLKPLQKITKIIKCVSDSGVLVIAVWEHGKPAANWVWLHMKHRFKWCLQTWGGAYASKSPHRLCYIFGGHYLNIWRIYILLGRLAGEGRAGGLLWFRSKHTQSCISTPLWPTNTQSETPSFSFKTPLRSQLTLKWHITVALFLLVGEKRYKDWFSYSRMYMCLSMHII